jgi:hypothetical protein
VSASVLAAKTAVGQVLGGHDEEPRRGVEVSTFSMIEGLSVPAANFGM